MKKKILIGLIALLLSSCTTITRNWKYGIVEDLNTTKVTKGSINFLNLFYANNKQAVLDIGIKFNKISKFIPNYGIEYVKYPEVRMELLREKGKKNNSAIFFVHGGAYLYPMDNLYRELAEYMIQLNNTYDIYFVDYRQLPNYFYPTGNEDVEKGLKWLMPKYEKIYMMGDSAGGNLVLSNQLKRRDEGKKLVNGIVLISPFLDISDSLPSRVYNKKSDILIGNVKGYADPILLSENPYYNTVENKKLSYISPVFGDLNGLPNTFIEVGTDEVLFDDSKIIHKKMPNSIMNTTQGYFHVYQLNITMPEARNSIKRILNFIDSLDKK